MSARGQRSERENVESNRPTCERTRVVEGRQSSMAWTSWVVALAVGRGKHSLDQFPCSCLPFQLPSNPISVPFAHQLKATVPQCVFVLKGLDLRSRLRVIEIRFE